MDRWIKAIRSETR